MRKVVFWGNSAANVSAIEEIRKSDRDMSLAMVIKNQDWPVNRHLFTGFLAKDIKESQVLTRPAEFYKQNNVEVLFDQRVSRVDFKRNTLVTEEKQRIDFDILAIGDAVSSRLPDIKGTHRDGVFGFQSWDEIREIFKLLPIIDTVIVQGDDIQALLLVSALNKRGKEVSWAFPSRNVCPRLFSEEQSQSIIPLLSEKGINVLAETNIKEILGDVDAKAVRLPSGKVLAAQMVIFTETAADLRVLHSTPLETATAIKVSSQLKTNLENVYAFDRVADVFASSPVDSYELSALHLARQGLTVGLSCLGSTIEFVIPQRAFKFFLWDLEVSVGPENVVLTDSKTTSVV